MNTFIDLFAGIGGFRVALERFKLQCVFTSEIDKYAAETYSNNFSAHVHGDITKIDEKDIPQHDILCAGFPCQSFSINGKRLAFDDLRGNLFYQIVRIAQYHKPALMLLENVKHILFIDDGYVLKTIIRELNDIGYTVHYSLLNSSNYGVPQCRDRVYFVCLRNDADLKYQEPMANQKQVFLVDILEKNVDSGLYIQRDDVVIDKPQHQAYRLKPIRIGQFSIASQGYRIYHVNGHAITLVASGSGMGRTTGLYYVGNQVRRLSINECKRLMGFPDDYDIPNSPQGYKQLGNSVVTDMIKYVYDGVGNK